jgi:GAF domain-containing protein
MNATTTTDAGPSALTAAISGALADLGPDDRQMLGSIVRVARAIMGAAASSIFLLDAEAGELVFEAVSGEGEGRSEEGGSEAGTGLVGTRFPADRGIAGWVVATGEPMAVADLASTPLFARDLAERTGFVPNAIMAVPVTYRHEILGVLQVLDPHPRSRASIADLDLLAMFATQAGLALSALVRNRAAQQALAGAGGELQRLAQLVRLVAELEPARRVAGLQLVDALRAVLAHPAR